MSIPPHMPTTLTVSRKGAGAASGGWKEIGWEVNLQIHPRRFMGVHSARGKAPAWGRKVSTCIWSLGTLDRQSCATWVASPQLELKQCGLTPFSLATLGIRNTRSLL